MKGKGMVGKHQSVMFTAKGAFTLAITCAIARRDYCHLKSPWLISAMWHKMFLLCWFNNIQH